jgi:hypothetical protein
MLGRCPPQIKRIVGYESQRTGGHCWVFPDETRSNGSHSWTVFFCLRTFGSPLLYGRLQFFVQFGD